ncbi:hypothetical protein FC831_15310 [Clostridium botulinum]|nr:hypothetical protein [Clostridium botulinum]
MNDIIVIKETVEIEQTNNKLSHDEAIKVILRKYNCMWGYNKGIITQSTDDLKGVKVAIKLPKDKIENKDNSDRFKTGTIFYTVNEGKMTVDNYIDKFKMYSIKENNKLFKHDDIQRYIDLESDTIERSKKRQLERIEQERIKKEYEDKKQKEYEFCYNYLDNKTALQKGRVLKVLNKEILYNGEFLTKKEIIHNILKDNNNCVTKEFLNTNRYKKKNNNLERVKLADKIEYML